MTRLRWSLVLFAVVGCNTSNNPGGGADASSPGGADDLAAVVDEAPPPPSDLAEAADLAGPPEIADLACGARCACMPEVDLGQLKAGESKMARVDVTRGQAGLNACKLPDGGLTGVVRFALPAAVTLSISFSQTGDHVLRLFADGGPASRCDAVPLNNCLLADDPTIPVEGAPLGARQAGTYFLLVQAVRVGSEGVVDLTLSAR